MLCKCLQALPRAALGQDIGSDITRIIGMALDPDELRLGASLLPGLQPLPDGLDDVQIHDISLGRSPSVLLPLHVPLRHALDRVLAVGADLSRLGIAEDLQCSQDRHELGPLVCLGFTAQAL